MLHEDITSHQQAVAQCIQDIEQFLRQYNERVSSENASKLSLGKENLKERYDVVLSQSYTRLNQLNPALEDVQSFERDITGIEDWLMEAGVTIEELIANVGTDYDTLKLQLNEHAAFIDDLNDQKGDLKFINMSGDKFHEQSKVRPKNCLDGIT